MCRNWGWERKYDSRKTETFGEAGKAPQITQDLIIHELINREINTDKSIIELLARQLVR